MPTDAEVHAGAQVIVDSPGIDPTKLPAGRMGLAREVLEAAEAVRTKRLERAAKAAYSQDPLTNLGEIIPWDELNEHVRIRYRARAKAVLASIEIHVD